MYISVMFVSYMAAAFIALLGVGLILLLLSKKENRSSVQYRTAMSFAFVVLAECILYSYFYFADTVLQRYEVAVGLRIIDYLFYAAVLFFWLRVIDAIDITDMGKLRIWSWIIGILYAGTGVIGTAFFMDDYYSFPSESAGMIYTYLEASLALLTLLVTARYTFDFARNSVSRGKRIYVVVVSVVILIWVIQQIFIDSSLYLGIYKSAWAESEIDTTSATMFIVGLATFLLLFREDFSPLYYAKAGTGDNANVQDDENRLLDRAAEQHHLTVRELDVLRLVYKGMNNAEIADELYISINTVKKHLKNIYEKMGTSSRMELVYIISQMKEK